MHLFHFISPTIAALVGAVATPTSHAGQPNGLVDLGYAKHIPTSINTTTSGHRVAIYRNIRFANPPTGALRFRHPDTDLPHVDGVQGGDEPWRSRDCIASAPGYIPFPEFNGTTWGREDCLFLDVYVPEGVMPGDDVPVLHWFFGGAYAFGGKEMLFSPLGLFEQMFVERGEKFIFVVNSYRLGVSGFTYSDGEDMEGNVGLVDCLAAAEWTARYIRRFGGDRKRITAAGQSAGAGMMYYMTVLYSGKHKLPFQQMFLSSPAVPPRDNVAERQRELYNLVLDSANCTSLDCLRSIPEADLIAVNDKLINHMESTGGGGVLGPVLGFGPAPDGRTVLDIPLREFQRGAINTRGLKRLMVSNMANEGLGTSREDGFPEYFAVLARRILPGASDETVAALQERYWHPEEPGRLGRDWTTDVIWACNAYNIANALAGRTKRYVMSAAPAYHGQDMLYIFYVDQERTPVEDVSVARSFQSKLLTFIRAEDLDGEWPTYGVDKEMLNITGTGLIKTTLGREQQANCDLINGFVLDPANGA